MTRNPAAAALLVVLAMTWVANAGPSPEQAATSGQAPAATGAISGVVVDANTGKAISGAVVALSWQGTSFNVFTGPSSTGQVTDSAGRFVFTGLAAGAYRIGAGKAGYFDGGYDRTLQVSSNRPLALAAGQWVKDVTVRLSRHTSISGSVLDEAGEAVVGVWVQALARILIAGEPQWVVGPATKTDDRGMYRFAGLAPGPWIIMVPSVQAAVPAGTTAYELSGTSEVEAASRRASGGVVTLRQDPSVALRPDYHLLLGTAPNPPPQANGQAQLYPITYVPAARQISDATIIDTSLGSDSLGVDVQLTPVRGFTVSGTVEGPADAIAGMALRLMQPGTEGLGPGTEVATSRPNTNGTFRFLNVPTGSYTIVASLSISSFRFNSAVLVATGRMPMPAGTLLGRMSGSSVASAPPGTMFQTLTQSGRQTSTRMAMSVSGSDVDNLVLTLGRGVTIRGRVVHENTPTLGRSEPPLNTPPTWLRVEPANGDPGLPRASVVVDSDSGAFAIEGIQPGEYLLGVEYGSRVKSIIFDGRDYTYRPLRIAEGSEITGIEVTLTTQTTDLTGSVRSSQGRPLLSGTTVIAVPLEREQWSKYGVQPSRLKSAPVASDGSYRLPGLPGGDYFVFAVDDEHGDVWKNPARLERVTPSASVVSLPWGASVRKDLTVLQLP